MGWLFGLFLAVTTVLPTTPNHGLVSTGYICATDPSKIFGSSKNTLQLGSFECISPGAPSVTPTPQPPPVCRATDIVLVLDRSGTMGTDTAIGVDRLGNQVALPKYEWEKRAAVHLAEQVFLATGENATNVRFAAVSYGESLDGNFKTTVDVPLSSDYASVITQLLASAPEVGGGTCIECALRRAREVLSSDQDASRTRIVLLISNGNAATSADGLDYENALDQQHAIDEARVGKEAGMYYYVLAHNADNQIKEVVLQTISSGATGDYYRFEPLPDRWDEAMEDAFSDLCPDLLPPPTRNPTRLPTLSDDDVTPTQGSVNTPTPSRRPSSTPWPTPTGPTPTRRATPTKGPTSTPRPTLAPPTPSPTSGPTGGWDGY